MLILDKDKRRRVSVSFEPESKTVGISVNDEKGSEAIQAVYREDGFDGKPITTVSLKNPRDQGMLMLSSGPGGKVGVVVQDETGNVRSKLDRHGASRK